MRVTLTVTDGPHAGKVYAFAERDSFLVGRSKDAHFALPRDDPYFSRRHFLVEVNPPRCRLHDLNSRNGTTVNGRRVESVELGDGDTIKAGHTIFRLTVDTSARSVPSDLESGDWQSLPPDEGVAPPPAPGDDALESADWQSIPPDDGGSPPTGTAVTPTGVQSVDAATFDGVAVPGYRPVRWLGEGGMGIVYQAERLADGAVVALKMLKTAPGVGEKQVRRFRREARILGDLRHPHIVGFHESGAVGPRPYLVLEYVAGTDADALLKNDGPLSVDVAVGYVCQLLDALDYAHRRRFVHRDVKPANMLLEDRGGAYVVRLADFGLARAYDASQLSGATLTTDRGGTIAYMAPEQVTHFRDAGAPADQYSAAASLYHLLTGHHTHDFHRGEYAMIQILTEEPVPIRRHRRDVPVSLAAAIHRALAKPPAKRFADVAEFRAALEAFRDC